MSSTGVEAYLRVDPFKVASGRLPESRADFCSRPTAPRRPLVAVILRPGKAPSEEVVGLMRRLLRRIRRHWPKTRITIRRDSHYGRKVMVQAMIAFIDDHRATYGVEPICKVLPIAPSTYQAHAAQRVDPGKL
jgi:Transposase DDE domain group 1